MNTQGFILFIFSICAAGILILIYPKYLHRYFQKYLIVLILGAITLAYVFFGRFLPIFIELIDPKNAPDPKIQTRVSNMLSLDMCPFMALCFPLLMILDKKRKYLIIMAPFAFFGGAISIFGASFSDFEHGLNPASITWSYIFVGNKVDHLFFMMHFALLLNATIIMCSTRYYWQRMVIGGTIWCVAFFIYAILFAYSIGIQVHAFGVVKDDWLPGSGQFGAVAEVTNTTYPWSMIIGYVFFGGIIGLVGMGFNYIKKIPWYAKLKYDFNLKK